MAPRRVHKNLAAVKSRIDVKESQSCGRAREAKLGAWKFSRPCVGDLFSAEAEELSLFGPIGRQPRRQTNQRLGGELRGLSAVDDGRGDVGRQPRKPQEGVEVGCRHLLFSRDVMHGELEV